MMPRGVSMCLNVLFAHLATLVEVGGGKIAMGRHYMGRHYMGRRFHGGHENVLFFHLFDFQVKGEEGSV